MPNNDIESVDFWGEVQDAFTQLADLMQESGFTAAGKFFGAVGNLANAVEIGLLTGQGDVTGFIHKASEIAGSTIGGAATLAAINQLLAREASKGVARTVLYNLLTREAVVSVGARLAPLIIANPVLALAVVGIFVFLGSETGQAIGKQFGPWLTDLFGNVIKAIDPLVLDLDGGGVSLTALASSYVYFDLNNNNYAERTGWVSAGDGLLALDANRNGRIDNGTELFGSATQNGFEALRVYDDNKDGAITSADAIWSQLLVWRDGNGDGVSSADELTAVSASTVASINLIPRKFALGDSFTRNGNAVLAIGNYTQDNGIAAEAIAVGFSTDQTNTRFIIPEDFAYDPEVFVLPNLRGHGGVPDLWVAMSLDPVQFFWTKPANENFIIKSYKAA